MWSPTISSDELYHHGILGMKWGIRRYQNKDGTLTPAGRRHLGMGEKKHQPGIIRKAGASLVKNQLKANVEQAKHNLNLYDKQSAKRGGGDPSERAYYELDVKKEKARYDSYDKTHPSLTDEDKAKLKNAAKTALQIGATVAVAYASYKVATDPRIRRMMERGIDKLKGVNTKQSIEQLIANSGPEIVKTNRGAEAVKDIVGRSSSLASGNSALKSAQNIVKNTSSTASKEGTSISVDQYMKGLQAKKDLDAWKASKNFDDLLMKPEATISEQKFFEAAKAREASRAANTSVKKATATATKASGPKLEFGGPSSSSSSSDTMERLLKNSKTLSDIAKSSASNSNWATEYESYTRQLLNKNNAMLKNMTMDDLKKYNSH